MKATIHGVAVEGTPQEIMEYQRMQAEKAAYSKPPQSNPHEQLEWAKKIDEAQRKTGSGSTTNVKRCEHPCYCTGACEGRTPTDSRFIQYANPYNPSHLMLPGTVNL